MSSTSPLQKSAASKTGVSETISPKTVAPETAAQGPAARLMINNLMQPDAIAQEKQEADRDVIEGLKSTPKTLPPQYFYDDLGSELFEKICTLPEYYLTRTETAILTTYAPEIAAITGPCDIVELGSGSSTKTRILLNAYVEQSRLIYCPIDVSAGILKSSAEALLKDYPSLEVHGLVSTYEQALASLPPAQHPHRLICFIGSTLGNLSPESCMVFLRQIRESLQPGDFFLLGVDLEKPAEILEAAYNDGQGITAEFNLNMLRHLNRKFDGNFNLDCFEHRAQYNPEDRQIEMHLRSLTAQTVALKALGLSVSFAEGEIIRSEISRKFSPEGIAQSLSSQGLTPVKTWMDSKGWFAVTLSIV